VDSEIQNRRDKKIVSLCEVSNFV